MFSFITRKAQVRHAEVVSNEDIMYGAQRQTPKDHIEAAHLHNVKIMTRYTARRDELEDLIARSREELEQVEIVIASIEQADKVLEADFKAKMDAAAHEAVSAQIA